jgi:signal peptidase I
MWTRRRLTRYPSSVAEPVARRLSLPRWGVVVASYLVPGLGQIITGRIVSGILWFAAMVIGMALVFWAAASPRFAGLATAFYLAGLMSLLWICMLIHTYRVARDPENATANKPWIGVLLSCFFPGLGQFYVGERIRGILFIVVLLGTGVLPEELRLIAFYVLQIWSAWRVLRWHRQQGHIEMNGVRVFAWTWVAHVLVVLLLVLGIRTFLIHPFKIPTAGMEPTLHGIEKLRSGLTRPGDHIFVDKLTYRIQAPRRGDIIVFRTDNLPTMGESSQAKYNVKRIVGLPGERVSIQPPFLYINGQRVTTPPILETIQHRERGYSGYLLPRTFPPAKYLQVETDSVQLGEDEYFVLADNSAASLDSRFWGPLPKRNIVGGVTRIYWPWGRVGVLE